MISKDNRSKKVISICCSHIQTGCREVCPLSEACVHKAGDTKEIFDARMNKAAENLPDMDKVILNGLRYTGIVTGNTISVTCSIEYLPEIYSLINREIHLFCKGSNLTIKIVDFSNQQLRGTQAVIDAEFIKI